MTVAEFIKVLSAMPPEAVVIYQMCSEYDVLNEDDPQCVLASEKQIVLHHGRYMDYVERHWKGIDWGPEPTFATVCTLPGN